jgi:hypothetical protein
VLTPRCDVVYFFLHDLFACGLTLQRNACRLATRGHNDDKEPPDEEGVLHDPEGQGKPSSALPWRNVGVLLVLISGFLCLFIFYPVLTFIRNNARNLAINGNIRINATGQAPVL